MNPFDERMASVLLQRGLCSASEIEEARSAESARRADGSQASLGQILVEMGYLDGETLLEISKELHQTRSVAPPPLAKVVSAPARSERSESPPTRSSRDRGITGVRRSGTSSRAGGPGRVARVEAEEPKKRIRVWIAFAASFLLSFPLLLGLASVLSRGESEDVASSTRPPSEGSLFGEEDPPVPPNAGHGGAPAIPTEDREGDPAGAEHALFPDPEDRGREILAKARDWARAKNYTSAIQNYSYYLQAVGEDPSVRSELKRVEAARQIEIGIFLEDARLRLARGDLERAREQVEVVLWWSPGHPEATDLWVQIAEASR